MKIYLDCIVFALQSAGGISVYWSELVMRFLRDSAPVCLIERKRTQNNLFRAGIHPPDHAVLGEWWPPLSVARYLPLSHRIPKDALYHSSYYRTPWRTKALVVQTVYDFTYERSRSGLALGVHSLQKMTALNRADGIICISESTKRDLAKLLPQVPIGKVRVIYPGRSLEFRPLTIGYGTPRWDSLLKDKFVVFVGVRQSYKNFAVAVEAVAAIPKCSLAIVGGGELSAAERDLLNSRLRGRYACLGQITNRELNELYNIAHALIYPSAYEGFGIPVVEAMSAGCPVIAVNVSSIPEAAGEAGLLVQEATPESILEQLALLDDTKGRRAVVQRGLQQAAKFSWETCYQETRSFYQQLIEARA